MQASREALKLPNPNRALRTSRARNLKNTAWTSRVWGYGAVLQLKTKTFRATWNPIENKEVLVFSASYKIQHLLECDFLHQFHFPEKESSGSPTYATLQQSIAKTVPISCDREMEKAFLTIPSSSCNQEGNSTQDLNTWHFYIQSAFIAL